ncbi:MAG: spondin domain-containing protein [Cyclobacteriaceae bacterium]|nr:spondin domain-containing protein [Cyclobacteriaceae bacterium HetDA_MAG_MS6]
MIGYRLIFSFLSKTFIVLGFVLTTILAGCEDAVPSTDAQFVVTIRNLSSGERAAVFSTGIFFTQRKGHPLFFNGAQVYGNGLEELAEDGSVNDLLTSLAADPYVGTVSSFPPIPPGEEISFSLRATYGDFLNFATMFTESNDLFYSFDDEGFFLFEPGTGEPITGDFTKWIWLWDAGTEENQEPYSGSFQAERQSIPGEGVTTLEPVTLVNDGFSYPPKFQTIQITIESTTL